MKLSDELYLPCVVCSYVSKVFANLLAVIYGVVSAVVLCVTGATAFFVAHFAFSVLVVLYRLAILYHFDRKFTNSENLLAEMADKFSFLCSSGLKRGFFAGRDA